MPAKLNLGGGYNWSCTGWENLELTRGWDLEAVGLGIHAPETVAKIYASHSLEHLKVETTFRLLQDCYKVLQPGGAMRVVVPDCELFARAYLEGNTEFYSGNKFVTPHFSSLHDMFIGMGGGPRHGTIQHQWFWDRWTMAWALTTAGFPKVNICAFQEGDEEMRHFDNPDTAAISCYVEAFRG